MMDSDFLYLVETELANAREKYPKPVASSYEARGFIADECEALSERVKAQGRDTSGLLANLVQIAAICYRAAEDLQLLEVAPAPEPEAHQWCQEHKGKRFRADDPNAERLGMAVDYVCLHGVRWTITGACLDALRPSQFDGACDCEPPWPTAEEIYTRREALPNYKF